MKNALKTHMEGGNDWLHPDVVGLQPVNKGWNSVVKSCAMKTSGQSIKIC